MNIVFFGTPKLSSVVLQKLIDSGYKPSLVITSPDKPVGRKKELTPSPVKILATKYHINILQPNKLSTITGLLRQINPDLLVVAAYGKIIPKEILDIPKYNALNIHPSLLPKYRGPSPIQSAILNGDKKTGATIMLMDEKMDHGPLITNYQSSTIHSDTYETLGNKLFKIGADLLIEILPKYLEGKTKLKKQNHKKATYTKIIKREDGLIDWNKSADYIEHQLRAFTPWPGIYTIWEDKRLKILELEIQNTPLFLRYYAVSKKKFFSIFTKFLKKTAVGQVIKTNTGFAIQSGNGFVVPKKLQLEGKNPQTAKEFLNGHPKIIGSHFI